MSVFTTILNLFKTDMATDGNDLFDFDRDLNQNFDKVDTAIGAIQSSMIKKDGSVTFTAEQKGVDPTSATGLTTLQKVQALISANYIPANTTIYVATNGNNTTGDGTNSKPYATIQKALDYLYGKFLLGAVTIQVADGTYSHTVGYNFKHPQSFLVTIQGNATTPSNCILSFIGAIAAFTATNCNALNLNGFKLLGDLTANSSGLYSVYGATITAKNVIIDSFYWNVYANANSSISLSGIAQSLNAVAMHYYALSKSFIYGYQIPITGKSTSKSTHGVYCDFNCSVQVGFATISNCVTGISCTENSFVAAQGATYTSCTTNTTPAVNTVGNQNSYIYQ